MSDLCSEIQPLLAGYALAALDEEELRAVSEHLPSCASCRETLSDYMAVRQGLLLSPPPVRPPAGLRRRLAAAVRPAGAGWRVLLGWQVPGWAAIAGVVLLVAVNLVGLGWTWRAVRDQRASLERLTREQAGLAEALRTDQTAVALASYPTTEVVRLLGDRAYGTFVYDPDLKVAVLYAWGLEPLPADQTYQAWLIDASGGRTNGGVFQASDGGRFTVTLVNSAAPLGKFEGLGVTIEPAGGSPSPTGPRVLAADF